MQESKQVLKSGRYTRLSLALTLPFVPVVHALGFGRSKQADMAEGDDKKASVGKIIEQADALYEKNDVPNLYKYLKEHKDCGNDEVLWRLARSACDLSKASEDKTVKKDLMFEAFEYVKQALAINDQNYANHKWYAILLDYTAEYEGTKKRITNAFEVKEHLMKAIELNPKDSTSIYSLGYWCFLFADMPWYQRKVASVIFATPPTSTYDEALKYFLQAENMDPNFYSKNLLMLGKTYLRLSNTKDAIQYLTRSRDYPQSSPDDKEAHKEAVELLTSLGVKE